MSEGGGILPAVVLGCEGRVSHEGLILLEGHAEADQDVHAEEEVQQQEDVGRHHLWRAAPCMAPQSLLWKPIRQYEGQWNKSVCEKDTDILYMSHQSHSNPSRCSEV